MALSISTFFVIGNCTHNLVGLELTILPSTLVLQEKEITFELAVKL